MTKLFSNKFLIYAMKFCIIIPMHSLLLLEINFSRNFVIFNPPNRGVQKFKSILHCEVSCRDGLNEYFRLVNLTLAAKSMNFIFLLYFRGDSRNENLFYWVSFFLKHVHLIHFPTMNQQQKRCRQEFLYNEIYKEDIKQTFSLTT